MTEFRMPSLGADMEAGTLVRWRRNPGDRLTRGDVIAEVETDKGVIEVEVFAPGVLERWVVEPGVKVPVGTVLAMIQDESAAGAKPEREQEAASAVPDVERASQRRPSQVSEVVAAAQLPPTEAAAPTPARVVAAAQLPPTEAAAPTPARVVAAAQLPPTEAAAPTPARAYGGTRATPSARRRAREQGVDLQGFVSRVDSRPPPDLVAKTHDECEERAVVASPTARIRSSPAARKRAAVAGVDVGSIVGTGPGGAVVLDDVLRAERVSQEGRPRPPARKPDMRRPIAAAMARSKREIPHYYVGTTIDLGRVTAWLNERNAKSSVNDRLVPSALLLKAVALAAKRMPIFTVSEGEYEPPADAVVHLAVAVSLRGGGLIAPAIHHADRLSLDAIMSKLQDLVLRARSGGLRSSELSDGRLTVTSLGERGVELVLPIIHPPQTAIVGFGRIAERPWVVNGALAVRPLVQATLAADHRVTDGHLGGRFLALIDQLLQTPEAL